MTLEGSFHTSVLNRSRAVRALHAAFRSTPYTIEGVSQSLRVTDDGVETMSILVNFTEYRDGEPVGTGIVQGENVSEILALVATLTGTLVPLPPLLPGTYHRPDGSVVRVIDCVESEDAPVHDHFPGILADCDPYTSITLGSDYLGKSAGGGDDYQ